MDYNEYEALIHARARSWHYSRGIELGECLSIANLAFAEATARYKPELGAFSTYLWQGIDIQFKSYLGDQQNWAVVEPSDDIEALAKVNGQERAFRDRLLGLSGRARRTVADALQNPEQYLGTARPYPITRELRTRRRVASLGYTHQTADRITAEIREALS